ncbi:Pr6Pr family membrane protein [Microbacterium sp. RU33B]|uniref:Pr6Pr family membrane protein n=1 Tax=Microbacterium sp. RU33B TaxID=1907390 RepID=UPI00095B22F7|nr:Pr6Pr family membrane protein [Microbacterium sp. RU33B]SIT85382.1 hypothetical protein SAMN05880545_2322 [Microbacterium sp. RU33B]
MPDPTTGSGAGARIWTVLRLIAALAIAAAIVAQAFQSFTGAVQNGRHVPTIVGNFFSFFTILSNLLAVLVLLWAVVWFWTRGRRSASEPRALAFALASVTTYMIVTGVVYNLLLRGYQLEPGAVVPWSNEILHLAGPAFFVLDLFLGPRRRRLPWGAVVGIIVFPIVWVLYTLVRASFITNPTTGDPWWYPYPFLDPHRNSGPALLLSLGGIAVGTAVVALIVVWIGRLRARRKDVRAEPIGAVEAVGVALPSVAVAAAVADPVLPAPLPLPAAETVVVEPEIVEAEMVEPDVVRVEIVEAEMVEPDAVEAEIVEAEMVEPDAVEAEVVEPDTETPEPSEDRSDG